MRIINVVPEMDQLQLGKQGENKSTKFLFDVSDWLEKYPGCTITLVNRRPNENSSYPCVLTTEEDGRRGWVINGADLAIDGKGECELKCTLDDMIEKDKRTWKTKIKKSLSGDGNAPAPWESLMDDIEALVGDAQDAAEDAEAAKEAAEEAASIAAHAPIIQNGYWYEWDATTEQYVNTEVKAQGEDGDPGQDATPALITKDYSELTFPVTAGTMCYHSGLLYKANQAIATSEEWTAAHWTQTTIEAEQSALTTQINSKADEPTGTKSAGKVYGLDSNLNPVWVDGGGGGGGSVDPQDIAQAVADWCEENITEDPTVVIDESLLTSGAAADSLVAGGAVKQLQGMVSSIGENLNLFDVLSAKKNGRLSDLGVFVAIDGYFTSDYIPVKYGRTYTKNSQSEDAYHRYALYSSASESGFITSGTSNSITIDLVSEKYIRFSGQLSEIGTTYFNTFTPSAIDSTIRYMAECMSKQLRADVCSIGENLNLFDIVTAKKNGRMNESGVFVEVDDFFTSDYIPVENGKTYYKNSPTQDGYHRYCLYSSESESDYISESASNSNTITINNASAHYLRFSGRISEIGTARLYTGTPSAVDVEARKSRSISILFVGNSLTQDGIAYLPYMLKHYYPEVNFKLYMWYVGGATLSDHYSYFSNNTASEIFSVAENTETWTNSQMTATMSTVLSTYQFDVVCLQEYFNNKISYTDTDLGDWTNCRDYITEHYTGGNPLEFISMFHAPKRTDTADVFALTQTGNALILQKTITQDMIPNGISVYRALSTGLDALGDQGHLSPDGVHTQEGLPCLLQTYVTLCWLFEKLAINKSVYGCPFRMTTAIYNTLNVPGPNLGTGVITGTDAQNLLAQEVAIKAYKEGKKFVLDNLMPE